jgi:DNA-directed RNA polymerase subunit alpha
MPVLSNDPASHDETTTEPAPTDEAAEGPHFYYYLVQDLEVSVRTSVAMENAGISFLGELVQKTEDELLALEGMDPVSLGELREHVVARGLAFGTAIPDWPARLARWQQARGSE